MLSGRRLLIGDHYQLPPFEADRLVKILSDHSLVVEALGLAEQLVGPLMREGELDELEPLKADHIALREIAGTALRVLEPFRAVVEEDERRAASNPNHRSLAATLTEQRRMDPAIAEIVSKAFTAVVWKLNLAENLPLKRKNRPSSILADYRDRRSLSWTFRMSVRPVVAPASSAGDLNGIIQLKCRPSWMSLGSCGLDQAIRSPASPWRKGFNTLKSQGYNQRRQSVGMFVAGPRNHRYRHSRSESCGSFAFPSLSNGLCCDPSEDRAQFAM
jgi:hypothetical protein